MLSQAVKVESYCYINKIYHGQFQESKIASVNSGATKKPKIVIKENHQLEKESNEETSDTNLEHLIEQRDNLYKKAMGANGPHMQVHVDCVGSLC